MEKNRYFLFLKSDFTGSSVLCWLFPQRFKEILFQLASFLTTNFLSFCRSFVIIVSYLLLPLNFYQWNHCDQLWYESSSLSSGFSMRIPFSSVFKFSLCIVYSCFWYFSCAYILGHINLFHRFLILCSIFFIFFVFHIW